MADPANSTLAPCAPPDCPLPQGAPLDWLRLWESVCWTHTRAAEMILAAFEAGADPRQFCLLRLSGDDGEPMPQIHFGPRWDAPTLIVGPEGVLS